MYICLLIDIDNIQDTKKVLSYNDTDHKEKLLSVVHQICDDCRERNSTDEMISSGMYYIIEKNKVNIYEKKSYWFTSELKHRYLIKILEIKTEFFNFVDELKYKLEGKISDKNIKPSNLLYR